MTKQQALDLVAALEARKIGCDCIVRFDAQGAETWSVALEVDVTYTGVDLAALAGYCTNHNLVMTAQFSALGVV